MLDTNTNKIIWVAMAVGVVAILGLSTMILFPNAEEAANTQIHTMMNHFSKSADTLSSSDDTNSKDKAVIIDNGRGVTASTASLSSSDNTNSKDKAVTIDNGRGTTSSTASGTTTVSISTANAGWQKYYTYDYNESNKTATVTGLSGYKDIPQLVIPSEIIKNNVKYTVTTIAAGSLANKKLTSIDVPATVTSIGDVAFGYNYLMSLNIANPNATYDEDILTDGNFTGDVIITHNAVSDDPYLIK